MLMVFDDLNVCSMFNIKANLIKPMNVEVKLRKPRNQSLTMTMYSTVDVEPAMSG